MSKTKSILAGVSRGNCPDCGYLGLLELDGTLRDHAVRRVRLGLNGEAERYESFAVGDDHCSGVGQLPVPLPKAHPKYERIAA